MTMRLRAIFGLESFAGVGIEDVNIPRFDLEWQNFTLIDYPAV
jgi:hypothetical protein